MECPRCGAEQLDGRTRCERCGVVFDRLDHDPTGLYVPPAAPSTRPADAQPPGLPGRALIVGGAVAVAVTAVPFLRFVFSYLQILIHEAGHSATAWILGKPAVPALDLFHGGGVSFHGDRSWFMLGLVGVVWWWIGRAAWPVPRARIAFVVAVAAWSVVVFTPASELAVVSMGHGLELLAAGLFLSQAVSGRGVDADRLRPVYAFAGWFGLLANASLGWGLLTSHAAGVAYGGSKGREMSMDLVRIGETLGLGLETIGGWLVLLSVVVAPVAIWVGRRDLRQALQDWLND